MQKIFCSITDTPIKWVNKQLKSRVTIQNYKNVTFDLPNSKKFCLVATFKILVATCGDCRQGWTTLLYSFTPFMEIMKPSFY